jgi:hypothetical protein
VNRQTLFGTFGLLTLILAGAAIARVAGLPLDGALYLSACIVIVLAHLLYQRAISRSDR